MANRSGTQTTQPAAAPTVTGHLNHPLWTQKDDPDAVCRLDSRAACKREIAHATISDDLPRTGSWTACILATIAACALIFSAGAQNVAHGYQLGLASSEFRALVLAAASAGASVLGPFCWVAVVRGRGFGTRAIALVLALGCLAYASVCSLGFVAGSRDAAISERVVAAEAHQDKRALAKAARDELATLEGAEAGYCGTPGRVDGASSSS